VDDPVAADGLLHPVALASIGLLILNDHVLKAAFGNALTGKLSDVAGMIFFPLLLQAALEVLRSFLGRPWAPSRVVLVASCAATAIVFSLVNTVPEVAALWSLALGGLQWPFLSVVALIQSHPIPAVRPVVTTVDPTDLVTVPFVLIAAWVGWHRCAVKPSHSLGSDSPELNG